LTGGALSVIYVLRRTIIVRPEVDNMRLYYSPFACSLASNIAFREGGLEMDLVRVELESKKTALGGTLLTDNFMGQVPTLVLDDGRVLTENVAVLAYLGDRAPQTDTDRYELMRWLAFVSTEVHKKVLYAIFAPGSPDAVREHARAGAERSLATLAARLEKQDTLLGGDFTVADAYLFWALTILPHGGVSLERYDALRRYHERHLARPAVRAALRFERDQFSVPFAVRDAQHGPV
jgi:glutathione S-transferase